MGDSVDRVEAQQDQWERLAQDDPLWAIISHPSLRGNQWDVDGFFDTGTGDLAALLAQIDDAGLVMRRGRCLDFGCGVGRLSQALATVFGHVDGVDIAPTMIERAQEFNKHGDRCSYHVNAAADLGLFDADTFDLVFSTMVLQHISSEDAAVYIEEFMRILAPGGIAVFDMPSHVLVNAMGAGGHSAQLHASAPGPIGVGELLSLPVEVHNSSPVDWPASMSIRLGNHWLDSDGAQVVQDDGRTPLLTALPAGGSTMLDLAVRAPDVPGSYQIELDMVEEGVAWFGHLGSPTLRLPVRVRRDRLRRKRSEPGESAPPFSMNALPRERVTQLVVESGGRVVVCRETGAAGPEWKAFRYIASVS